MADENNKAEILKLKVKPNQQGFIETTLQCLFEADELSLWRPVGIYVDEILIGFAMYGFWEREGKNGRVWLDRFLIDEKYQGKGYSKPILKALINHIIAQYHCSKIYLSIYEDNDFAIAIYQCIGFKFNGELDINGEKVMKLEL